MLTQDHANQVQTLLDTADRAFDADDLREGARLMWEASRVAIAAVAQKLGMPADTYDDIKQVVFHLDGINAKERLNGYPEYYASFSVVQAFKEHAETYEWELPEFEWEPDEYHMYRPLVKRFVARLIEQGTDAA